MNKTKILDGYVALVESWGSDERIIEAARMSTGKGFEGWEKDEKLLAYLYNNKHSTPFEMAGMIIEVKAPIFVFREWHRHRTQCLSGNTELVFERPVDGKAYRMKLSDVVRKWNPSAAKRRRPDQSPMSLEEFNRNRLSNMKMRGSGGSKNLVDAWHSGEKRVFNVKTKYGQVVASEDHLFKTPDGGARLCDGLSHVMALVNVGGKSRCHTPIICQSREEWREVMDGLEVSNHGNARSYFVQGAKSKRQHPTMKKISMNAQGRAVVSFGGKTHQVSRLVAGAFYIIGDGGQVLHKNDNPMDNRVENLYVGSAADNMNDQFVNGGRKRLREVPVEVIEISSAGIEDVFDITVTGNHWFVANNLLVHNSYNEMSARYIPLPDENYMPSVDRLMAGANTATTNKQAQGNGAQLSEDAAAAWATQLGALYAQAQAVYEAGLALGVPKELARLPVPVARYSRMRASANLRNWLAFLTLRQASAAQWEIRQYANAVGVLIAERFPHTWALFAKEQGHE